MSDAAGGEERSRYLTLDFLKKKVRKENFHPIGAGSSVLPSYCPTEDPGAWRGPPVTE